MTNKNDDYYGARKEDMISMWDSGRYTLQEIGDKYGNLSRQRVEQIVKNRPGGWRNSTLAADRRVELMTRLGGVCVRCGFSDARALQFDHINGGGWLEKNKLGANGMYRLMLSMTQEELSEKYQLLCANCNWIKRIENDEVPRRPQKNS